MLLVTESGLGNRDDPGAIVSGKMVVVSDLPHLIRIGPNASHGRGLGASAGWLMEAWRRADRAQNLRVHSPQQGEQTHIGRILVTHRVENARAVGIPSGRLEAAFAQSDCRLGSDELKGSLLRCSRSALQ